MKRIIDQKATKERIRELRIQRGYTQEEIADIMGGSRSYYNSMETGNRELNEKYLETLAKIFDVDWDEICIYVESEYDKLEKTMNILDSYRPTNYYMVRYGNLAEDIIDLIKYFGDSKISEYNLLDPIFNNLGFDIKLINIQAYIQKWNAESDIKNARKIRKKSESLLRYFNEKEICILAVNRNNQSERYLISIDKFIELEDFIYHSLIGNLEFVFEEYDQIHSSLAEEDLDEIISDNIKEEDEDAFFDRLIHYSQAKKHLLDINEYIGKLLDMEETLKQNSEDKNNWHVRQL